VDRSTIVFGAVMAMKKPAAGKKAAKKFKGRVRGEKRRAG